jgi:hypothetical protein
MAKWRVDHEMVDFRDAMKSHLTQYTAKRCLHCGYEQDQVSPIRVHDRCVEDFISQLAVELLDIKKLDDRARTLWGNSVRVRLDEVELSSGHYSEDLMTLTTKIVQKLTRDMPVGFTTVEVNFTSIENQPETYSRALQISVRGNPVCFYCQSKGRDVNNYYALMNSPLHSISWASEDSVIHDLPEVKKIHPALELSQVGNIYVHQSCLSQYLKEITEYAISHRISYPPFEGLI